MEIAIVLLAVGLLAGLALARLRRRLLAARSRREGREGAEAARRLLRSAGYRITGTEVVGRGVILVDGRPQEFVVRADAIARRWFRRYVVEVKGAPEAASPANRDTRRQLLEYAVVFGTRRVLLVDVPGRTIRCVKFPALG